MWTETHRPSLQPAHSSLLEGGGGKHSLLCSLPPHLCPHNLADRSTRWRQTRTQSPGAFQSPDMPPTHSISLPDASFRLAGQETKCRPFRDGSWQKSSSRTCSPEVPCQLQVTLAPRGHHGGQRGPRSTQVRTQLRFRGSVLLPLGYPSPQDPDTTSQGRGGGGSLPQKSLP